MDGLNQKGQNKNRHFFKTAAAALLLAVTGMACEAPDRYDPEDVQQARELLQQERQAVLDRQDDDRPDYRRALRMIELGLWDEAHSFLEERELQGNPDLLTARARLDMERHRYHRAEERVGQALQHDPEHLEASLLQVELEIQAWRLNEAARMAEQLMERPEAEDEATILLGEIAILEKEFDRARELAGRVVDRNEDRAGAWLLKAEAEFWDQEPGGAEEPLQRALSLDPLNADARYSYGYAIWRRGDARLLEDMAAQWNLAMDLDPMHYFTHWHFGNGHTHKTYEYYAEEEDDQIRERLAPADDELIPRGRIDEALELAEAVQQDHPESILPKMLKGSIYYMAYNRDDDERLAAAERAFREILEQKPNYGPAHNGLAAVIKQRQFRYLDRYEELVAEIEQTPVPEDESYYDIFYDVEYYPGDRVTQMVNEQIGFSRAYLPLIHRLEEEFTIPPLHIDLATAMDRSGLRHATTFDNRQWMDIRGAGSGAAAIEYVERGSFLERNVLAHEYAHLFHGRILTAEENRRIRSLYHQAKEEGRALDYYAANNEGEYFAQGYEAYIMPEKVHPLNHKAMNEAEDLRRKDPDFYSFLDSLEQRQQAYLNGDESAFDSYWAQTYVTLSGRLRRGGDMQRAEAKLDSALAHDPQYIPAHLSYASLLAGEERFDEARGHVDRARELDGEHAPVDQQEARLLQNRAEAGDMPAGEALKLQEELYERALELEEDLSYRAGYNEDLRSVYRQHARIPQAVATAGDYVEDAPVISTYLEDRKEAADAFRHYLYSRMGHTDRAVPFFEELVASNPQHFRFRRWYAEALRIDGRCEASLEVLEEGHRILEAAGDVRPDYLLHMAVCHIQQDDEEPARQALDGLTGEQKQELGYRERLLLARVKAGLGQPEEALDQLPENDHRMAEPRSHWYAARARIHEAAREYEQAAGAYRSSLEQNPYHLQSRASLAVLLEHLGEEQRADQVRQEGEQLEVPPGRSLDVKRQQAESRLAYE